MENYLPVIVPFFGAAVILSWSVTCCTARRLSHTLNNLQSRVEALEIHRATVVPSVPIQTLPYAYPQQMVALPQQQQQQPPPYNRQVVYYIPPQQQQQVRASAPL